SLQSTGRNCRDAHRSLDALVQCFAANKTASPHAPLLRSGIVRHGRGIASSFQHFSRRWRKPAARLRHSRRVASMHDLAWLNSLTAEDAAKELLQCCGSRSWTEQMSSDRPYPTLEALLTHADRVWWALTP